jgi:pentatricopeptide repeat protein
LSDAEAVFESLIPRDIVSWNAMLNAFARNGCVEAAHNLFLQMVQRDSASWNTLISTFTEHGLALEALGLFQELCFDNNNGSEPNEVTFLCALDACSSLAELAGGELIHAVVSCAMHDDIDDALANALINMYGKCGSLSDSLAVFGKKRHKDVVSWNAAIGAAALNGHGRIALELLSRMIVVDGKTPNGVTFACVLIACGFVGLLDEGKLAFLWMGEFGIRRSVDHYACFIDLLGRSGLMDEAECLINAMPFNDVDAVWSCILGACHIHNDTERGIKAVAHCFQSGLEQCSSYVLLSNIYANAD